MRDAEGVGHSSQKFLSININSAPYDHTVGAAPSLTFSSQANPPYNSVVGSAT